MVVWWLKPILVFSLAQAEQNLKIIIHPNKLFFKVILWLHANFQYPTVKGTGKKRLCVVDGTQTYFSVQLTPS